METTRRGRRAWIWRVWSVLLLVGLMGAQLAGPAGARAADEQLIESGRYRNAAYDFTLTWDPDVWHGYDNDGPDSPEGVFLTTGDSDAMFALQERGRASEGGCVDYLAGRWEGDAPSFTEAPRGTARPVNPLGGADGLYETVIEADRDGSIDAVLYLSCVYLGDDQQLIIYMVSRANMYENQLPLWEELLTGLDATTAGGDEPVGDVPSPETYASDEGYAVEYDAATWSVEEGDGSTWFTTGDVAVQVLTLDVDGDAEGCVAAVEAGMRRIEAYSDVRVANASVERPETARGAAGELYVVRDADAGQRFAVYVECRELEAGHFLSVQVLASYASYADQLPIVQPLLDGIRVDGGRPRLGRQG